MRLNNFFKKFKREKQDIDPTFLEQLEVERSKGIFGKIRASRLLSAHIETIKLAKLKGINKFIYKKRKAIATIAIVATVFVGANGMGINAWGGDVDFDFLNIFSSDLDATVNDVIIPPGESSLAGNTLNISGATDGPLRVSTKDSEEDQVINISATKTLSPGEEKILYAAKISNSSVDPVLISSKVWGWTDEDNKGIICKTVTGGAISVDLTDLIKVKAYALKSVDQPNGGYIDTTSPTLLPLGDYISAEATGEILNSTLGLDAKDAESWYIIYTLEMDDGENYLFEDDHTGFQFFKNKQFSVHLKIFIRQQLPEAGKVSND